MTRGGTGDEKVCYNCGKVGHIAKDCPEPRKPREDGDENKTEGVSKDDEEGEEKSGDEATNDSEAEAERAAERERRKKEREV